ncbi:MAG TPA: lysylphosphatidylglycerol synthase domain-containing protein, partial [Dongiaceae bacterium]|nr:lysylphosphatidylglycerol synthase domain-containing protein [Dongiaceae bacterium]
TGSAWRALLPTSPSQSRLVFLRLRWIREAINNLLPVAQIGGEVVGARLLARRGVPLGLAGASAAVDLTVEMITQILFTLVGIGLLLLLKRGHGDRIWEWLGPGLPAALLVVVGFIAAQRFGLMKLIELGLLWLARRFPSLGLGGIQGLHDGIRTIHANRRGLLRGALCHSMSWFLGTAEVWVALAALGHPVSVREAFVIESLGAAMRSTGFAVPAALGVQEAGLIIAAAPFGVPPELAIALSMVKRLRELAFGIPGLVAWQWSEGRHLAAPAWTGIETAGAGTARSRSTDGRR